MKSIRTVVSCDDVGYLYDKGTRVWQKSQEQSMRLSYFPFNAKNFETCLERKARGLELLLNCNGDRSKFRLMRLPACRS